MHDNKCDKQMNTIDELLQKFKKCDIFTPDNISQIMSSYLYNDGNILEPSVGDGQLLKYINIDNYDNIDIYDIKKEYLDKCPTNNNINKYHEDFIIKENINKYKNIILNPPYIKIQDLSKQYRDYIRNKWEILNKGNLDIYYAFILKCINLLDDDGIMVAITPNSYLYNKGSLKLRKYLIDNKLIKRIIDYKSEKVFKTVSTYCCITIFTKENKDSFIYNDEIMLYSNINNKEYNIFNKNTDINSKTLNDICIIKNGIATLRDKIYIHGDKLYNEPCWKPVTTGKKNNWCIFPYNNNAVILNEDYFKNNNPKTYNYLEKHKKELAKRDKGNKTYPKWYSYGRTQSLKIPNKDKILYIPIFADPENIIYKIESPKLCIGCLSLEVKDEHYTIEQVKEILEKNKNYIIQTSSKRGDGWLNMSSRIIKQIVVE
tara:strand:- start:1327 stop:2616 length:1290 start_codon:yes stop_codon:yes gene_type:complete